MPSGSGDPAFARALQTYLTLHKRRSSYSAPSSIPTSPLPTTTTTTTTSFPFSSQSPMSRHSSIDSSNSPSPPLSSFSPASSSGSASPCLKPSPPSSPLQDDLLRGKALEDIDQGIFASLEEMLRSKTGREDKRSRQWIETRLMQKEQELRMRHGR